MLLEDRQMADNGCELRDLREVDVGVEQVYPSQISNYSGDMNDVDLEVDEGGQFNFVTCEKTKRCYLEVEGRRIKPTYEPNQRCVF